jgi:hypothetical protein
MDPLAIYISAVAVLLIASLAVGIWRHVPTRKCHLCGAKVEIGKSRCQVCGYRFVN